MKDKTTNISLLVSILLLSTAIRAEDASEVVQQSTHPSKTGESIVYTIQGKKDPRLKATFLASYISTSRSEACSYKQATTASRKVRIADKAYPVTEENYRIKIPIFLEESETECGYRFSRIELVLQRNYDNSLYSKHIVLDRTPKARAIYRGSRGGFMGVTGPKHPAKLTTSKKYFRVATETNYICMTWFYSTRGRSGLVCRMQIKNGEGKNKFIPTNPQKTVVTHPEFGTDQIKSEFLTINMIADDENSKLANGKEVLPDYFRTLPKPEPSPWQKIKNEITTYFN
ncbi:hypothetical protein [Neptuniibacter sp. 1_MG-2023]|jgi:hypothetical protein|uniref:hypothetical protein n=1 Tax=Neptuniibacter sp. 1_MG-2023 TaxID=3062662 RepID=UPI0026E25C90|nr:hypothetical protein [Neptuniibacter sp. 1_MG-2023]MDO6592254.1 hypothetical protein [Neptuniibacter sp. 1_MG-2023]